MNGPSEERATEWTGGSLSELMSVLSAAALPSRIRVFAPGPGDAPAGEVHLLAGGLNDAFAGDERGEAAVAALQRVAHARFLIDTRLPDPETGSLAKPGPAEGNLAQRPLVEVMRYCEQYVLTCTLEVWRGEDQASINYRRGELVGTTVGGSDAPERLPEVMGWKEGFFEIALPLPVTPPVPALSKRSTASMAVAGASAGTGPARPPSGERVRRKTDPLISIDAVKHGAPAPPAAALARPTGESGPKLPPGPPLPGLQARGSAVVRSQPAAGPPPSGPTPATPLAAAPISRSGPLPSVPVRTTAQAPIAARTTAGIASARPLSTPAAAAQPKKTPPLGIPVLAPKPPAVAPSAGLPVARATVTAPAPQATPLAPSLAKSVASATPPAVAPSAGLPVARAPVSAPVPQAPALASSLAKPVAPVTPPAVAPSAGLPVARAPVSAPAPQATPLAPSLAKPVAPATQAAAASPRAAFPSLAAKPPVAQTPARPVSAPAPKTARTTPAQGSAVAPSLAASPASSPAGAVPVQHATPAPAKPPSAQPALAAAAQKTGAAAHPRPSEPLSSQPSSAIHGDLNTATHRAQSASKRTPGEMRRSLTPVRGTADLPSGVELSEDMQDPAAYVDTPPPQSPSFVTSVAQSTPTPVSPPSQNEELPTVRLSTVGFAPSDLSVDVDIDEPRFRPSKPRSRGGVAHWPLLVHVLLGVALGAAIVLAYSAYYGLPIP